jgi:hypothetical protein
LEAGCRIGAYLFNTKTIRIRRHKEKTIAWLTNILMRHLIPIAPQGVILCRNFEILNNLIELLGIYAFVLTTCAKSASDNYRQ